MGSKTMFRCLMFVSNVFLCACGLAYASNGEALYNLMCPAGLSEFLRLCSTRWSQVVKALQKETSFAIIAQEKRQEASGKQLLPGFVGLGSMYETSVV